MRVFRIDRFDDPRIEDYRNVTDAEWVRRRGLFVAEGRLVVGRVIEDGHRVVSLLLNDAAFRALEPSIAVTPEETPVYICETDAFNAITGFNLHRGCLALVERPAERTAAEIADSSELVLVLEGVTDADNVGSVFRNAAAFGAGGVFLSPTCCDPLYRKAIRTSMGSVLRVPYARIEDWPAGLVMLKAKGFTLVALTPRESAIDLDACERRPRMAVIVGSEGPGLMPGTEAMADVCVRIPIHRKVDSLNLATASGIALYCLRP